MRVIADLHIHSKYSRATSKQMEPVTLDIWAKKKGIGLIATGDFTHPRYLAELKNDLVEDGSGFLTLGGTGETRETSVTGGTTKFVLSGEISCIYKDKDKTRRLHLVILIPDFATADKIIQTLEKYKCNLKSDGRPIIGLSAKKLAEICFEANEKTLVIPAHVWTPWFAVFGSKSGYDRLEECFEELTPKIYAIETGLSSDPAMNWRLSALDNLTLISNSDAHSPANIGREANVFDFEEFTYNELYETLKKKNRTKFLYTIEFFPEEGKYHYDGHASCKFVCPPEESKKLKNICPSCKKNLVLGVDHRVVDLADRDLGFIPDNSIPFKSLIPLQEIIAECLGKQKSSKCVGEFYENLIANGGSEFNILLDLSPEEIEKISNPLLAEAIRRMRNKKIMPKPGYDGIYGIIKVFNKDETDKIKFTLKQKSLF